MTLSHRFFTVLGCLSASALLFASGVEAAPVTDQNAGTWSDSFHDNAGIAPGAIGIKHAPFASLIGIADDAPCGGASDCSTTPREASFETIPFEPVSFDAWKKLYVNYSGNSDQVRITLLGPNGESAGPFSPAPSDDPLWDGQIDLGNLSPTSFYRVRLRVELKEKIVMQNGVPLHLLPSLSGLKATWSPRSLLNANVEVAESSCSYDEYNVRIKASVSLVEAKDLIVYSPLPVAPGDPSGEVYELSFQSAIQNGSYYPNATTIRGVQIPAKSVVWELGDKAPGDTFVLTYTVHVPKGVRKGTFYSTKGYVSAKNANSVTTPNAATSITSAPKPNIGRSTTHTYRIGGRDYINGDRDMVYNLTISNTSSNHRCLEDYYKPVLWDDVSDLVNPSAAGWPGGPVYDGAIFDISDGGAYTPVAITVNDVNIPAHSVYWELDTMKVGSSASRSYSIHLKKDTEHGGPLPDGHRLDTMATFESGVQSEKAQASSQVYIGIPNTPYGAYAKGDKIRGASQVGAGRNDNWQLSVTYNEPFSFLLQSTNQGASALNNTWMVDKVPDGVNFSSAHIPSGTGSIYYHLGGENNDPKDPPEWNMAQGAPASASSWSTQVPANPAAVRWVAFHVPKLASRHFPESNVPNSVTGEITVVALPPMDGCTHNIIHNKGLFNTWAYTKVGESSLTPYGGNASWLADDEEVEVQPIMPNFDNMSVTGSPGAVSSAGSLLYGISLPNRPKNGVDSDTAYNVELSLTLPQVNTNGTVKALALSSQGVSAPGATIDYGQLPNKIVLRYPQIEPNGTRNVSVGLELPRGYASGDVASLTAKVTADSELCGSVSANASRAIKLDGNPYLQVTKSVDLSVAAVESQLAYTLRYWNRGDTISTKTWIVDRIPTGTRFHAAPALPNGGQVWFSDKAPPTLPAILKTGASVFTPTLVETHFVPGITVGNQVHPPQGMQPLWIAFWVDDSSLNPPQLSAADASGQLRQVTWTATVNANAEIGELVRNDAAILSRELIPAVSGEQSTMVSPNPALEVARSCVDVVTAGESFTYQLAWVNNSTNPDYLVKIQEQLPQGLRFVSATHTWNAAAQEHANLSVPPQYNEATGSLLFDLSQAIDPSGNTPITALQGGLFEITVVVEDNVTSQTLLDIGGLGLASMLDGQAPFSIYSHCAVLVQNADLYARIGVDQSAPVSGETVTYTLMLSNEGAHDAEDVSLQVTLEDGLSYVPGSTLLLGGPWAFLNGTEPSLSPDGQTLTWRLSTQNALSQNNYPEGSFGGFSPTANIAIQVKVADDTPAATSLTAAFDIATVTGEDPDYTNHAEIDIRTPLPDLYVTKSGKNFAQPGEAVTYLLRYGNKSRQRAEDLFLVDRLHDTLPGDGQADMTVLGVTVAQGESVYYNAASLEGDVPAFNPLSPSATGWTLDPQEAPINWIGIYRPTLEGNKGPYSVYVDVLLESPDGLQPLPGSSLINRASIQHKDEDDDPTDDDSEVETKTPGLDISAEAICSPEGAYPGLAPKDDSALELILRNSGTVAAHGLKIQWEAPSWFEVQELSLQNVTVEDQTGLEIPFVTPQNENISAPISWHQEGSVFYLGSPDPNATDYYREVGLPAASLVRIQVTGRVRANVQDQSPVSHELTVTTDYRSDFVEGISEEEEILWNNLDSCGTTVYRPDPLVYKSVDKNREKDLYTKGDRVPFIVEYNNAGSIHAHDVALEDDFPEGSSYVIGSFQNQPEGTTLEFDDGSLTYQYVPVGDIGDVDPNVKSFRLRWDAPMPAPSAATFKQNTGPHFSEGLYENTAYSASDAGVGLSRDSATGSYTSPVFPSADEGMVLSWDRILVDLSTIEGTTATISILDGESSEVLLSGLEPDASGALSVNIDAELHPTLKLQVNMESHAFTCDYRDDYLYTLPTIESSYAPATIFSCSEESYLGYRIRTTSATGPKVEPLIWDVNDPDSAVVLPYEGYVSAVAAVFLSPDLILGAAQKELTGSITEFDTVITWERRSSGWVMQNFSYNLGLFNSNGDESVSVIAPDKTRAFFSNKGKLISRARMVRYTPSAWLEEEVESPMAPYNDFVLQNDDNIDLVFRGSQFFANACEKGNSQNCAPIAWTFDGVKWRPQVLLEGLGDSAKLRSISPSGQFIITRAADTNGGGPIDSFWVKGESSQLWEAVAPPPPTADFADSTVRSLEAILADDSVFVSFWTDEQYQVRRMRYDSQAHHWVDLGEVLNPRDASSHFRPDFADGSLYGNLLIVAYAFEGIKVGSVMGLVGGEFQELYFLSSINNYDKLGEDAIAFEYAKQSQVWQRRGPNSADGGLFTLLPEPSTNQVPHLRFNPVIGQTTLRQDCGAYISNSNQEARIFDQAKAEAVGNPQIPGTSFSSKLLQGSQSEVFISAGQNILGSMKLPSRDNEDYAAVWRMSEGVPKAYLLKLDGEPQLFNATNFFFASEDWNHVYYRPPGKIARATKIATYLWSYDASLDDYVAHELTDGFDPSSSGYSEFYDILSTSDWVLPPYFAGYNRTDEGDEVGIWAPTSAGVSFTPLDRDFRSLLAAGHNTFVILAGKTDYLAFHRAPESPTGYKFTALSGSTVSDSGRPTVGIGHGGLIVFNTLEGIQSFSPSVEGGVSGYTRHHLTDDSYQARAVSDLPWKATDWPLIAAHTKGNGEAGAALVPNSAGNYFAIPLPVPENTSTARIEPLVGYPDGYGDQEITGGQRNTALNHGVISGTAFYNAKDYGPAYWIEAEDGSWKGIAPAAPPESSWKQGGAIVVTKNEAGNLYLFVRGVIWKANGDEEAFFGAYEAKADALDEPSFISLLPEGARWVDPTNWAATKALGSVGPVLSGVACFGGESPSPNCDGPAQTIFWSIQNDGLHQILSRTVSPEWFESIKFSPAQIHHMSPYVPIGGELNTPLFGYRHDLHGKPTNYAQLWGCQVGGGINLASWGALYRTDRNPRFGYELEVPNLCQASMENAVEISTSSIEITESNNRSSAQIDIARSDLSGSLATDKAVVSVGESIQYKATIRNHGPNTAHLVEVTLRLPDGEGNDGEVKSYLFPRIEVGESREITESLLVTTSKSGKTFPASLLVSGQEIDCLEDNNNPRVIVLSGDLPNVYVDIDGPMDLPLGEDGTWTFTVGNNGNVDAENVTFTAPLPVDVNWTSSDLPSQCTLSSSLPRIINCSWPLVRPQDPPHVLSVTGMASSCEAVGQNLAFSATVNADLDINEADNHASFYTKLGGAAGSLELQVIPGRSTAEPGDSVIYTVHWRNAGLGTVTGAKLKVAIPTGSSLVESSLYGNMQSDGQHLTLDLPELPGFAYGSSSFEVIATSGSGTSLLGQAGIEDATGACPVALDYEAVKVQNAGLHITKEASTLVSCDEPIDWIITVVNRSSQIESGLVVTDLLPLESAYVIGSIKGGEEREPFGNTLVWNLPDLGPGEAVTLGYRSEAPPANGSLISNVAVLEQDGEAVASSASTLVRGSCGDAPLRLKKAWDAGCAVPGQELLVSLTVQNTGYAPLTDVLIEDHVSTGIAFLVSEDFDYDPSTQKLSLTLGELLAGEQKVVTWVGLLESADNGSLSHDVAHAYAGDNYQPQASNQVTSVVQLCDDGVMCTVDRCELFVGCQHVWTERPGVPDNQCDGIDDNCNGVADEEFIPSTSGCGTGYCASTGVITCPDGATEPHDSCVEGTPLSDLDDTCDGVDDNCNGETDEDYLSEAFDCGGACAGGTVMTECLAGEVATACEPLLLGTACDSGDACASSATCDGEGSCEAQGAVECEDRGPCWIASCDAGSGCMYDMLPDGTSCDDGSLCTEGDQCLSGQCVGAEKTCDDDNACQVDGVCNPSTGLCDYETLPGNVPVPMSITSLGTLGGSHSRAMAINENGWVAGESAVSDGSTHAFIWLGTGNLIDLTPLHSSQFIGMNEAGLVVMKNAQNVFVWTPDEGLKTLLSGSQLRVLPPTEDNMVFGNDGPNVFYSGAGQQGVALIPPPEDYLEIVLYDVAQNGLMGGYLTSEGDEGERLHTAFIYTATDGFVTFQAPSELRALNDNGQGTGFVLDDNGKRQAVIFGLDGSLDFIDEDAVLPSWGTKISASGMVTGQSELDANTQEAFVYSEDFGKVQLGSFGGPDSEVTVLTEDGIVAGFADTAYGTQPAFIWKDGTGSIEMLESLGSYGAYPVAVTTLGGLAGNLETPVGTRAFFWDPIRKTEDLGTFGGESAKLYAATSAGIMVGEAETAEGFQEAFMSAAPLSSCVECSEEDLDDNHLVCPVYKDPIECGDKSKNFVPALPSAWNACGLSMTLSNNAPESLPVGESVISYTAENARGKSLSCDATVTVVDTRPPSFSCPDPQTVPFNTEACGGQLELLPVVEDACDDQVQITDFDGTPLDELILPPGENRVTLKATDAAGNSSLCSTTVTVLEPKLDLICEDDLTLEAPPEYCGYPGDGTAIATDHCGSELQMTSNIGMFDVGVSDIDFYVEKNDDSASCTMKVTVLDVTAPVLDCGNVEDYPSLPTRFHSHAKDACGATLEISLVKCVIDRGEDGLESISEGCNIEVKDDGSLIVHDLPYLDREAMANGEEPEIRWTLTSEDPSGNVSTVECSSRFDLSERDRDQDGVPDHLDNCPDDYNPEQLDSNGSGIGDVCSSAPYEGLLARGNGGCEGGSSSFALSLLLAGLGLLVLQRRRFSFKAQA